MKTKKLILSAAVSALTLSASQFALSADTVTEAITGGKAYGDFRLRYEGVTQDNALKDATALTLRSRIGYTTDSLSGLSATIEMEDSRVVGSINDYNDTLGNGTEYSVIADPETTELDQFLLSYKSKVVSGKLGRQVYTLDNHRYVGHVGWRQDRQTFDALTADITPFENLSLKFAYIDQRNRIFAEAKDVDSEDFLLNASYKTKIGSVKAYGYSLKDVNAVNLNANSDTAGVSFGGAAGLFNYHAEYATQSTEDYKADYYTLSGGVKAGPVKITAGYEVLGSDEGEYGFATPLATLHKFNGWADMFLGTPATGLQDASVGISAKPAGIKLAAVYHMYSSVEDSLTYGDELDFVAAKKFGKNYNAGIKYAMYKAEDYKVDTDKLWVWVGMSF